MHAVPFPTQDLKHSIIDDALTVMVSHVIIPCSGWDGGEVERDPNVDVWWSTVFKNASGVLRLAFNVLYVSSVLALSHFISSLSFCKVLFWHFFSVAFVILFITVTGILVPLLMIPSCFLQKHQFSRGVRPHQVEAVSRAG